MDKFEIVSSLSVYRFVEALRTTTELPRSNVDTSTSDSAVIDPVMMIAPPCIMDPTDPQLTIRKLLKTIQTLQVGFLNNFNFEF